MALDASTPWTGYSPSAAWDEAMDVDGGVREPYSKVYSEIDKMSSEDLYARADALANTYLAQGVTFDHAGEERPFLSTSFPGSSARTNGRSSPQVWPRGCARSRPFWRTSTALKGASPTE